MRTRLFASRGRAGGAGTRRRVVRPGTYPAGRYGRRGAAGRGVLCRIGGVSGRTVLRRGYRRRDSAAGDRPHLRFSGSPASGRQPLYAGAVSRPDVRVQGLRRRIHGPHGRPAGRRGRKAGDSDGDVGRHGQCRGARFLRRAGRRGGAALSRREDQPPAGVSDDRARRQYPSAARGRNLRRLPAAGQGTLCGQLFQGRAPRIVGQFDQPAAVDSAGVLLLLRVFPVAAGVGRGKSGGRGAERQLRQPLGRHAGSPHGAAPRRIRRGVERQRRGARISADGRLPSAAVGADAGQCDGRRSAE